MIGDFPRRPERSQALELTALVDVFFLVLVFFLLTAGAVRVLSVDLPKAQANSEPSPKALVVALLADGRVVVEGQVGDLETLKAVLQRLRAEKETAVRLEGDKRVPLEHLVKVLALLETEGVAVVDIAVQPH